MGRERGDGVDIISVNFETGAVTGSIDKFWNETHIVKEEKTMPKPCAISKEQFLAAVKEHYQEGRPYATDKAIAKALYISIGTVANYRKKYADEILSDNTLNEDPNPGPPEADPDINVGTIETIEIIGKTVFAPSAGKGENIQDLSSNLPPVITTANQADHDIVSQTTADEPDTECPADVADTNVGNMDEPQEISVQVAIEWRDQLDEEIEHVNRLLDPIGPACEIMTYRIELGLKEIRAEFEQQIKRINAVLGETRVRI